MMVIWITTTRRKAICRDIVYCMGGAKYLAFALGFGGSSLVVVGERQADIYPSASLRFSSVSFAIAVSFAYPISTVVDEPGCWPALVTFLELNSTKGGDFFFSCGRGRRTRPTWHLPTLMPATQDGLIHRAQVEYQAFQGRQRTWVGRNRPEAAHMRRAQASCAPRHLDGHTAGPWGRGGERDHDRHPSRYQTRARCQNRQSIVPSRHPPHTSMFQAQGGLLPNKCMLPSPNP
ncbi:hypothetical protein QBC39DRAFT_339981 [Podospora conica]|nr:hypothetical protein QBC39DRAFT_339981 [Schizothecium conicum]